MSQVALSQVARRMARQVIIRQAQHIQRGKLGPIWDASRSGHSNKGLLCPEGFFQEQAEHLAVPFPNFSFASLVFRVFELNLPVNEEGNDQQRNNDEPGGKFSRLQNGVNGGNRLYEREGKDRHQWNEKPVGREDVSAYHNEVRDPQDTAEEK